MSHWLTTGIVLVVSVTAAVTDYRTGRIPNRLTFIAMFLGVMLAGICHGTSGILGSILGFTVCAIVPGIVYKLSRGRGIGGGDLKLFAALGALLGPTQGLEAELSSFLLLGVFALFKLTFEGQLGKTLLGSLRVLSGFVAPSLAVKIVNEPQLMCEMRMGPAIAVGVATALLVPFVLRWLPWLA